MPSNGPQVGQRVMIDPDAHDEFTPEQLAQPYTILKVVGDGDDAMCSLKDDAERIVKWIRADSLLPARADLEPRELPRITEDDSKEPTMDDLYHFSTLNAAIAREATRIQQAEGCSLRDATLKAGRNFADKVQAYHLAARDHAPAPPAQTSAKPLDVTQRPGYQRLHAAVERVVREEGIANADAFDKVLCASLPDAGSTQFSNRVMRLRAGGLDACAALLRASHEDPAGAEAYRLAGL